MQYSDWASLPWSFRVSVWQCPVREVNRMNPRLKHLVALAPPQQLARQAEKPPLSSLIVRDNQCPIYAYVNGLSSARSKQTARRVLMAIAKHLGASNIYQIKWQKIDKNALNSLLTSLSDSGLAPDTITLYLSVVKSVLKEAFLLEQIPSIQYERIKSVKAPSGYRLKTHHILDRAGFYALLENIERGNTAQRTQLRDSAIFYLMLGCGLRRFEIAELQLEQIKHSTQHLQFIGKGNKERMVKIHPLAYQALMAWIAVHPFLHGAVFIRLTRAGTPYHKQASRKGLSGHAIYGLCKKYGLLGDERIPPHSLRRSFATWLSESNTDLSKIKAMLGHSTIKTTELYVQQPQEEVDEALLNGLFKR
ncbi:tyrosine-type recombinase/integrase [Pseudoalteromonas luteoviolacea]|uniref:tyrosine-type recombinase/integrase n=1 Tax=Pseudoalteromonas luteoviolacea TaxID=43657 RepID=UPI001B38D6F5|nr:tyrosine-type recombinase/integrase [Pseudoalteromonas luteoviolacea]MBQ4813829.1 tyrosine-type recombinase/integrase [Pseudoalteromonas luteoviolacea]